MKRVMTLILTLILVVGLAGVVLAANGTGNGSGNGPGMVISPGNQSQKNTGNQTGVGNTTQFKNKNKEYKFVNNKGQETKIRVQENNQLRVNMSNGQQKDLKILPETASETARQRLMLNGFNLTLKEVGNGTNMSIRYLAEGEKPVRVFGLFKSNAKVSVEIDPDTGEVLEEKNPWWYFLSSGKDQLEE